MSTGIFNAGIILLLIFFTTLYIARYRNLDPEIYSPAAAWTRACIFFCACFLASWLTGTQAMILATPIVTDAQLQDTAWLAWTAGLTVLILVGYWGIWARFTLRFDRKLHLATQIPFGLLWGTSMGQLMLIFWRGFNAMGATWPVWQVISVTVVALGFCLWLWMDFCWDLYVAPEHDTIWSIMIKTFVVHIPQSALCLIYVTLHNNFTILIALQTLALIGAAVSMRMPSFLSTEPTPPARKHPFIFGLVRAGGYVSPDPANDPYLRAAHLPR